MSDQCNISPAARSSNSVEESESISAIQLKLSAEDSEELSYSRYSNSNSPLDREAESEDYNNNNNNTASGGQPITKSDDDDDDETQQSSVAGQQTTSATNNTKVQLDDTSTIELRLLVRRREAGALIGKRGANIKRLREQFRSSIFSIPDTGNGPERVVCVATSDRWLGPILEDLTQVLVEKSADSDDQLELKLLIHSSQAGSIIGLGGQSIKKLRNDSKAAIKIYELCCPYSSERVCAIKAKPPVIVRTIKLIQSVLNQNPVKGTVKPYDALHFDPMLADKYGGYLPDDELVPANTALDRYHHLNHHHLNHNNQYPAAAAVANTYHHHHHQRTYDQQHHHPLAPIGFGRPQAPMQSVESPIGSYQGNNQHYSVWRSPEFQHPCNDISCFAASAAAAAAAAAASAPRANGKNNLQLDHLAAAQVGGKQQSTLDTCEHHTHHSHLMAMDQLIGAYAAAAAANRSRGANRFHPYGHVNYHDGFAGHHQRVSPAGAGQRGFSGVDLSSCHQQQQQQFHAPFTHHCHRSANGNQRGVNIRAATTNLSGGDIGSARYRLRTATAAPQESSEDVKPTSPESQVTDMIDNVPA